MDDETNRMIELFILAGFMEVAGIDAKTGEFLYAFTPKMREANPELFYELQNAISNEMLSLWAAGFLDITVDGDDAMVRLTPKCTDLDAIEELSEREQEFLLFIIQKFEQD